MEYKTSHFLHPHLILKNKKILDEAEYDKQKLDLEMVRRLRLLVKYADKIPYYRKLFRNSGIGDMRRISPEKIFSLPVLTKDDVRENFRDLQIRNKRGLHSTISHTSGSTGTALEFYQDKYSNSMEFAALWNFYQRTGFRLFRDKFVDMSGRTRFGNVFWDVDRRVRRLRLTTFNFTERNFREFVRVIRKFRGKYIRGYPSSLSLFAKWLKENGIEDIKFNGIITSSETCLDFQREIMEDVFGSKVFDYYGQLERVAFIGQCEKGRYHINPVYGLVNISGKAGKKSRSGSIIATGLNNRTMPLINYDTRDVAVLDGKECECGRVLPTVKFIYGRIEDFIVTPDGRYVGRLDAAFKLSPGIKLSQIIQEERREMIVKIVKGPNYGRKDEQTLLRELRLRVGNKIKIKIEHVNEDDIRRVGDGKFRFVISKVGGIKQILKP